MLPHPLFIRDDYQASDKLAGRGVLIMGGDSGIGRAVAVACAREGADMAIVYLDEHNDAQETVRLVEATGRTCRAFAGDIGREAFCRRVVTSSVKALGRLDILVNNAAEQHPQESLAAVSSDQLLRTFRTNIFSYFYFAKALLPHFRAGASIINTTSVTAYR